MMKVRSIYIYIENLFFQRNKFNQYLNSITTRTISINLFRLPWEGKPVSNNKKKLIININLITATQPN